MPGTARRLQATEPGPGGGRTAAERQRQGHAARAPRTSQLTGPLVRCEITDGLAFLTLNRPSVRNALSRALLTELTDLLDELDGDPAVGAIILTGADPAFSAGVDLTELRDPEMAATIGPRTDPILRSGTPLIGAVNGACYTGGLELALACHFLIASERATFADTHARLGHLPGWGLSVLLAEAVGVRRARQLSMTSDPITAPTALNWGLVNEVVPHHLLLSRAQQIARSVAVGERAAVRRTVALYDQQERDRTAVGWATETAAFRDHAAACRDPSPDVTQTIG